MYRRLLALPPKSKKSFFLFGPRATGKTSWLKDRLSESVFLDLLKQDQFAYLNANPSRLEHFLPQDPQVWIVIDEIQKCPALLNEVHHLIESKQQRFMLTGSSARSLRRQGVNLLAGRALNLTMHPLVAEEMGKDFNLHFALRYGMLPALCSEPEPQTYLRDYVENYLRLEVQQEGLTRNMMAFHKFLECASFSQGSVVNEASIARETGVDRKTIVNYFGILEDLLVATFLPAFARRQKRALVHQPKFFFFDTGVYQTLRPRGPLDHERELAGPGLETLILQHLRAWNDYHNWGYTLHHWRTQRGLEVDFILYGERGLKAIEIKMAERPDNIKLNGLKAFIDEFPIADPMVIYTGSMAFQQQGIRFIPATEFLINPQLYLE